MAAALLASDLPDTSPAEREAAARYVDDSVTGMPDVTRAGVKVASGVVYLALSVLGRAPYRCLDPRRQSALAVKIAAVPLPIVAEFSRLTRGLGLVGVFESRNSPALDS